MYKSLQVIQPFVGDNIGFWVDNCMLKSKFDIAGDYVMMCCQCLQSDIYLSLDFVQEFSLIENDFTIVAWSL